MKTINYISNTNKKVIKASMKTKKGIDELYRTISELFNNNELNSDNEIVITNIRHKNLIHSAINNLNEAENSIKNDMPIDVVAICIKEILESIGSITGDNVSEDIINKIFSKFCLGK